MMGVFSQPSLFAPVKRVRFDSGVRLEESDHHRLGAQIQRVYSLMSDGGWRTVQEIARATGDPEPSVSAQLRNLRKPKHGGYTVERRRVENHYEFRVVSHD